jgi:class 3 adenylate cyclase
MSNKATALQAPDSPEGSPAPGPAPLALNRGHDTTFFLSRGGHLLREPVHELLAMCERLTAQAQALGEADMIVEVQKIREAAGNLIARFSEVEGDLTPHLDVGLLLSSLEKAADRTALRPRDTERLSAKKSRVLVVDDCARNSEIVSLLIEQQGHDTKPVCDGRRALEELRSRSYDLILLDILMPELNGFQVLQELKADPALRHIPVIMLSGLGDMDSVICCIEMGAEDYLPKPFNPVLLSTRVAACLEKKHLRDHEEAVLKELHAEREKSERLLLNILPEPIAARLKQGEVNIAESFAEVTVLFADLAGFTRLSSDVSAMAMVNLLNEIFSAFDSLADRHGLEKIKTIGDAYMVVGGLPTPRLHHAEAVADMALDMLSTIQEFNATHQTELSIRIGLHTGPVIAGIIGKNKFAYDLWGDTVNLASRMESQGQPGCIQITPLTHERLKDKYLFQARGRVEVKGKGEMTTYLLLRRR